MENLIKSCLPAQPEAINFSFRDSRMNQSLRQRKGESPQISSPHIEGFDLTDEHSRQDASDQSAAEHA
jgi:hypothetical protein